HLLIVPPTRCVLSRRSPACENRVGRNEQDRVSTNSNYSSVGKRRADRRVERQEDERAARQPARFEPVSLLKPGFSTGSADHCASKRTESIGHLASRPAD